MNLRVDLQQKKLVAAGPDPRRRGGVSLRIRPAVADDSALVLELIVGLAEYERLPNEVVATEERVRESLFGPRPDAEVIIAELDGEPVGFALFFHNYSTFLARRGLYLEDLFVKPVARGRGVGRALLARLAALAWSASAGAWSGRCSTGTRTRSASTGAWAR
jgi:GNAT superfamily N-acetyltransferase